MKTLLFLILLGSSSACTLQRANRMTLVTSTLSLACDWGQTRSAAKIGWEGKQELNPMLGPSPTVGQVNLYFASAIVINAAIWYLMPDKVKSLVPAGVMIVQSNVIKNNLETTTGVCGL